MTFSTEFLQGNDENIAETIAALLDREWNNFSPTPGKPDVRGPGGDSDTRKTTPRRGLGLSEYILVRKTGEELDDEDTSNSYDQLAWNGDITIDVIAGYTQRALDLVNHVNKILIQKRPNNSTRVKKSNGTEDSKIAYFARPAPRWNNPLPGKEVAKAGNVRVQGFLSVKWYQAIS